MSKSSRSSISGSSSDGKHDDNDRQEVSAPIHYNDFGDNIANNNNNNNNNNNEEDNNNNNNNTNEEEFDDEYEREPVLCADARGRPAGVVLEDLNWRVEKLRLEEANKRRFLKAGPRFLPYAECQKWVQAWGLRWTSEEEWKDWIASGEKRNSYIPSRPEEYFTRTGDWISWVSTVPQHVVLFCSAPFRSVRNFCHCPLPMSRMDCGRVQNATRCDLLSLQPCPSSPQL